MTALRLASLPFVGMILAGCASMSGITTQSRVGDANALDAGRVISSAPRIERPEGDWWTVYRDPQLDALVARAVAGSPTLHAARARVALARAVADSWHAETVPQVGAYASSFRERFTALQFIPPPWGGHTEWNNSVTASLSYNLDLWGRLKNGWLSSLDEARAAAADEQEVGLELESAVVRSYIRLAMEFELRDIAEARLVEARQRATIERRRLVAGMGTQMAVSEVETALPGALARIEATNARIALLKSEIAALSGDGPGSGDAIARPGITMDASAGLPDSLPANLVGSRPDVLASRWRVEAAQGRIKVARAAFYPNINLIAFAGFQALGFGQLASNAAALAGAGPAISLPIFDGGLRRAGLSASTSAYDIAVERYNDTLVRALQEVSDRLLMLQSEGRQGEMAEQSLATAEKAHALALEGYHAGLSDYRHVLDTHDAVLGQEETVARLRAASLEAYAGLMLALGGGVHGGLR